MGATAIVGAHLGDEGKGRIVDNKLESGKFAANARTNGANNAGHTLVVNGVVLKLNQVPSGIVHPNVLNVIGNGSLVNPKLLVEELDGLGAKGINTSNFAISSCAHLILPWHPLRDNMEEQRRGDKKISTTGRGIGPCYSDKAARIGIRAESLLNTDELAKLVQESWFRNAPLLFQHAPHLGQLLPPYGQIVQELAHCADRLAPFIKDTDVLLRGVHRRGGRILLEGAQASLLDIDMGTYPNVSSSFISAAGACVGSGLPPKALDEVILVAKAYITRVGNGPLPTELHDDVGEGIRVAGHEFGTVTGRPRRVGWHDAVLTRFAAQLNGADSLALTKIDVLSHLDEIKVCYAYDNDDGTRTAARMMADAKPVYATFSGWKQPIEGVTRWADLPDRAKALVEFIEDAAELPVKMLTTGPGRESIIRR